LGAGPGDPRPALAHLVPGHRGALTGLFMHPGQGKQRRLLPGLPLGALDELVHHDRPALVPGAQRQPERGGGLALHLAGVHHDQRTVAALPGSEPVIRHGDRLALRHHATSLSTLTDSAKGPAASSSNRSRAPPRDWAMAAARPSRTGPDSQSTTTLCTAPRA